MTETSPIDAPLSRLRRFAWAVLVSATTFSSLCAQPSVVALDVAAIREAVGRPLPDIASLLDGPVRREGRPMVVIANLDERADDCRQRASGRAMGIWLRLTLWGSRPELAFSHPLGYGTDVRQRDPDTSEPPAQRAVRRTGADWLLHGQVTRETTNWRVHLHLDPTGGGPGYRSERVLTGPDLDQEELLAMANDLLARLTRTTRDPAQADRTVAGLATSLELADPGMGRPTARNDPASPDALQRLMEALQATCDGRALADVLADAWHRRPEIGPIAVLHARELVHLQHGMTPEPELVAINAAVNGPVFVEAYLLFLRQGSRKGRNDEDLLAQLVAILAPFRHEPTALYMLADAHAKLQWLYHSPDGYRGKTYVVAGPHPHHPRLAAAVALALAGYQTYPRDYRASWTLTYALGAYQDAVRGAYPRRGPEILERLPALQEAYRSAAFRALDRHPDVADLRLSAMSAAALKRLPWWHHFEEAVHLDPNNPWVYRAGLNYVGRPWGGSAQERARVYRMAKQNNPGADWPAVMFRARTPMREWLPVIYRDWLIAASVLLLALLLTWWWRR